jgi:hypothetical protein
MLFRTERPRRRASHQLEFLEPRHLLSAGVAARTAEVHAFTSASSTHTIRGTSRGTFTALSSTSLGSGTFLLVPRVPLGGFSAAELNQTASLSTSRRILILTVTNAAGVVSSSAGTLNVIYSGTGKFVNAATISFNLAGNVSGGTGAFAGATGHVKASGLLHLTTSSSGTFATNVVLTYTI